MTSRLSLTMTRTALVIASAVAGASCISGPDSGSLVGTSAEEIIGGDADTTDTAIVALSDVSNGSLCSGTLIAPSVVLTAGHCVDGVSAANLRVLVGSDTSNPDQTVAVTSAVPYPTYTSEANGIPGGVDLGFVTLATPLTIAPIVVSTTTTDAELTGASVTVIGYGVNDGTDNTGGGVRRAVVLPVTEVCSRLIQAGNETVNACVGDSGGAVLHGGRLVAVVSGGSQGCESPTNFMRTDAHANWIAAILAGTDAGTCATCVEPDPSCAAATETEPAGSAEEDAGSSDDAGAGAKKAAGGGGSGGGCDLARPTSGDGELAPFVGLLGILGLLLRARRRPRSQV